MIVYSVKRGRGDRDESWQAYGHEMAGNTITAQARFGPKCREFVAAVGVIFPASGPVYFYRDGKTGPKTDTPLSGFVPGAKTRSITAPAIAIPRWAVMLSFHY